MIAATVAFNITWNIVKSMNRFPINHTDAKLLINFYSTSSII